MGRMRARICLDRVDGLGAIVKFTCYNVNMWYKKWWGVGILFFICLLTPLFVLYIYQTIKFTYLFSTRDPQTVIAEIEKNKKLISVSRLFSAKSRVGDIDIKRIESVHAGPTFGNPKAKVRIVEFLDYGCPFTKQVDSIVQSYVRLHPADVFLMFRDLPLTDLHPHAELLAIAARCMWKQNDANRFLRYHSLLLGNQDLQDEVSLRRFALDVGANIDVFDECVKMKLPEVDIKTSVDDAVALDLQGTPTFFFNGVRIQGAMDDSTFGYIIDQAKKLVK